MENTGIYLVVEFDWPQEITREHAQAARTLHSATQGKDWIQEVVAGSGGIGGGPSSLWVFWLKSYAELERLMHDQEDEVGVAYRAFLAGMPVVTEKVRGKVVFL